jgi:inosine triphosphate pyrophosphatase
VVNLTFITGNVDKVALVEKLLGLQLKQLSMDLPETQSLDVLQVAHDKARAAYTSLGSPVLVQDTSLVCHALGKLPGPFIKSFLQELGNDGICRLLNSFDDRSARAEVCYAVCDESDTTTFYASVNGFIADEPRGSYGFGWDPIFISADWTKTWAEMTDEEYAAASMNRIALEKMRIALAN